MKFKKFFRKVNKNRILEIRNVESNKIGIVNLNLIREYINGGGKYENRIFRNWAS